MTKMIIALAALEFLLSACGSGGGSSSGSGITTGGGGSNEHVYTMEVTCQGTDFRYAPVLLCNGVQVSPGPQSATSGQTLSYSATSTGCVAELTGIGDNENNPNFYVSIVVLKDGGPISSANVGTGGNYNSGNI